MLLPPSNIVYDTEIELWLNGFKDSQYPEPEGFFIFAVLTTEVPYMIVAVLLILLGFALLIKGADWLVSGATSLAKRTQVSDLIIGLTIVSFGTSVPELVVNLIASVQHQSDIVLGNIIGSNILNLFLVLGMAGVILPISVQSSTVWKEIPISFLAALLVLLMANKVLWQENQFLTRIDGMWLFLMFVLFLYYTFIQMRKDNRQIILAGVHVSIQHTSLLKIWGFILLGVLGLVAGGKLVVDNAIELATDLGVSKKMIGLTIVAIGTSLPELVTSVVAALKKNSDIAIGNVIGSNIFNVFLVLSISALIHPISYDPSFNVDLILLLAGTAFLFVAMFMGTTRKLNRWQALILLSTYALYTLYLVGKEI